MSVGEAQAPVARPARGRLLLVDDDQVVLATLKAVLDPHVDVATARTVREGRRALEAGVDVLVTDFELTDGTGADLLSAASTRQVYSIVVTGKSGYEGVRRLQDSGVLVLFKPVDPAGLVAWVKSGVAVRKMSESRRLRGVEAPAPAPASYAPPRGEPALAPRPHDSGAFPRTRRDTMYDLTRFTLSDMSTLSAELRGLGAGTASLEAAATHIVRHLHDRLGDAQKRPAIALARFYKTVPFGALDPGLQQFGRDLMKGHALDATTQCLTLLGTQGARPDWCSRATSRGHKAIPLPSEKVVSDIPMIAQLIRQLGVPISAVLSPRSDLVVDTDQKSYNVFHVPDAVDSPYIPAQDFVAAEGVRSVLGFGGLLPAGGGLFAVILFSRVSIPKETAQMFRTASLSVKMAALPLLKKVFA
jgi:DNA-binding NarL/FixJ family response regulator